MKFTLRIKKNHVFKYVLRKGEYSRGNILVIHSCQTKKGIKDPNNFFAVCVSKKNGNSVQRNKLKRWAREVYKEEEKNLKKGHNIIIIYKKVITFSQINYSKVQEDIKTCFKELDLYE